MANAVLFVCESCNVSEHNTEMDKPSDGTVLVQHLRKQHENWARRSELDIQPTRCLWTCDHPCAIALSSAQKSTYVVAKVPVAEVDKTATALLRLSEHYLDSNDGTTPWKNFPEVLQTDIIARVPPLPPRNESNL